MTSAAATEASAHGSLDEATERYDTVKAKLKEGLERKRKTDQALTDLESQIYLYEGSYLSSTAQSGGNVIRGFDAYLKTGAASVTSTRAAAAPTVSNDDRLFSTSSATYQRSLALKMNETGDDAARSDDGKSARAPTSSGYKLKRKA